MTYQEALTYIHSTPNFARGAGLERITALLAQLGNPQNQLKFVHIAGTNGKGSTAAVTASVLQAAGYSAGLYTSPYLERFNERMQLNGVAISDQALAQLTEKLKTAVDALDKAGVESPNEFERVTAIALCWYAQEKADIVVLEVGLGGRYDATNVISAPEATAITSISLDHTGILGNTVEEIAGEKGGILKPGCPCILSADQTPGVRNVIRDIAEQVGAPLTVCSETELTQVERTQDGMNFTWQGQRLHLPLLGEYQRYNVTTVLHLVEVLRQRGWNLSPEAVKKGLEHVTWPGRLELMEGKFLLDCGHNPGGVEALRRELDTTFQGRPVVAVMGMLGDKAFSQCIALVAQRSQAFFAVSPPSPRALAVEDIAREAEKNCTQVTACTEIAQALELAEEAAGDTGLVVLCGSIPLVGEGRHYLRTRQK
jgi:dihydrofolate synthase/folylpolyglutamate synthase